MKLTGLGAALLLLLSGCVTLGGYESRKTAEGDEMTKAALVDVGTDVQGAVEAGGRIATRGIKAAREEQVQAQVGLDTAKAEEVDVDARIDAALDYKVTLVALRKAIIDGLIIDPDKSAVQDVIRQRKDGALTRAQANDNLQTYMTRYGLGG